MIRRIYKNIELLNDWVGRAVSWLNLVLVLLVCYDVLTRYLFNNTSAWIMELEWHIFALIFLLGGAYALKEDRHVRVDLFYQDFKRKDKALVDFIGTALFLLPWAVLLWYFATQYAHESFLLKESSPDPGGLPARYIIKYAIVIGFGLLFLQGIALLLKSGEMLFSKREPESMSKDSSND